MIGPEGKRALRALRDVGAVKAPWDHPGYRVLRLHRLASCTSHGDAFLYRMTPRGAAHARAIFL